MRIAGICGCQSFYVDLEHNSCSLDTTSRICGAGLEAGIVPLVRVPASRPEYVARVLDGGALGVIAPHASSAADVDAVVRQAKTAARRAIIRRRAAAAGLPEPSGGRGECGARCRDHGGGDDRDPGRAR